MTDEAVPQRDSDSSAAEPAVETTAVTEPADPSQSPAEQTPVDEVGAPDDAVGTVEHTVSIHKGGPAEAPEPVTDVVPQVPAVQAPVVEPSVVEAPVVEAPASVVPAVESPVVESPVVEAGAAEPVRVDGMVAESSAGDGAVEPVAGGGEEAGAGASADATVLIPAVPVAVAEPPVAEPPVVQAPVVEPTVAEPPVVQAPVVQAPVVETPVVQAPAEAEATQAAPSAPPQPIWPTATPPTAVAEQAPGVVQPPSRRAWYASPVFLISAAAAVVIVLGASIAAAVWFTNRPVSTAAVAGDCLKGDGIDPGSRKTSKVSLKIVACDSPAAAYQVVGRVNDQRESAATADSKLCDPYPGTQFIYWEGVAGKRGTVLCLAKNQKNAQ